MFSVDYFPFSGPYVMAISVTMDDPLYAPINAMVPETITP